MRSELSVINASLMSGPPENGFTKAMRDTFTRGYWALNPSHPQFNQELLRLTTENNPTIIFLQIQSAGIIDLNIISEIVKHSFIIAWNGDKREESPPQWCIDLGKIINLSLFSNMEDVKGCRKLGIASDWLECGVDESIYRPYPEIVQEYDVVAHFNHYTHFPLSNYRWEAVERLKGEFGNRFGVFGSFPGCSGDFNSDQNTEAKNYCKAKIALSISNFQVPKYASDRLNRIISTGVPLCLTHNFPLLEEMYYPGKHLVAFDNLDDLVFKCHYFLEHEEERIKVVNAGRNHFLDNYTFKKMTENIIQLYNKYEIN